MQRLRAYHTVLIMILILSNFLINSNAAAECPNGDPCPKQTQSGTIVENSNMVLKWATGHPPTEISPGTSVPVSVQGGGGAYHWKIVSGEGYSWENDETSQRTETPKLSNELHASFDAGCTVTIEVTDEKTPLSAELKIAGYPYSWDSVNSDMTFPTGETPIQLYVDGGKAPYIWQISNGFTLACENDCDSSNTVESLKTNCTGTISVTDACGKIVSGKIRRPGYWSKCGEKKAGATCYLYESNPCKETIYIDLGDHRIKLTSCKKKPKKLTTACNDGFQYTANVDQFGLEPKCFNSSYDSGIWWMYIYKWKCN